MGKIMLTQRFRTRIVSVLIFCALLLPLFVAPLPVAAAQVSLSLASGPAGSVLFATGTGVSAGLEVIAAYLPCSGSGDGTPLPLSPVSGGAGSGSYVVADSNERFRAVVTIPASLATGCYTLKFTIRRGVVAGVIVGTPQFQVTGTSNSPATDPCNPASYVKTLCIFPPTPAPSPLPLPSTSAKTPTPPTGLHITSTSSDTICFAWNASAGVDYYSLTLIKADGIYGVGNDRSISPNNTAYCDTGLQSGVQRCYAVRATNNSAQPPGSNLSDTVCATPHGTSPSSPLPQPASPPPLPVPPPPDFVPMPPAPSMSAIDYSHRYVIFLDGIGTHANPGATNDSNAYLDGDFGDIKNALRAAGYPGDHFVYFSYSAAIHYLDNGEAYCAGWDVGNACIGGGDLASLTLSPNYAISDTRRAPIDQANALDWLIGQVVKQDQAITQSTDPSLVKIDLVGFSLGGIVACDWAAAHDSTSQTGSHIRRIMLIDSPVGGIYPATSALHPGDFQGSGAALIVRGLFGDPVLTAVQVPKDGVDTGGSIVGDLSSIVPQRYRVIAIQSARDYLVSGVPVPTSEGPASIGVGTQYWPSVNGLQRFILDDLGGIIPTGQVPVLPLDSPTAFKGVLLGNHLAVLHADHTKQLVVQAITAS